MSAEKESEGVRAELAVAHQELCAVRAERKATDIKLLATCSELDRLRAEHHVCAAQEDKLHASQLALLAHEKELEELRTTESQERDVLERTAAEQRETLEPELAQTRDEVIRLRQDAAEKELELKELRERLAASQREIAELQVNVSAPVKARPPSPARRVRCSRVVIRLSYLIKRHRPQALQKRRMESSSTYRRKVKMTQRIRLLYLSR